MVLGKNSKIKNSEYNPKHLSKRYNESITETKRTAALILP
jgi:hypothetical protein